MPVIKNTTELGKTATAIDKAFEQYRQAVDAEIARVRGSVVEPFCRKYGIHLIAGNGEYWFDKSDDGIDPVGKGWLSAAEYLAELGIPEAEYKPVIELLDLGLRGFPADSLGTMMERIK